MTSVLDPDQGLPEQPLTTDDLRHKALAIRDVARDEARQVLEDNTARIVLAAALLGAVVLSVSYYMGTRAGRRACRRS